MDLFRHPCDRLRRERRAAVAVDCRARGSPLTGADAGAGGHRVAREAEHSAQQHEALLARSQLIVAVHVEVADAARGMRFEGAHVRRRAHHARRAALVGCERGGVAA